MTIAQVQHGFVAEVDTRRPIFAALMSAVLPGFGQLYNGQMNRAMWLFFAFSVLAVPAMAVIALFVPAVMTGVVLAIGNVAAVGVWLYSIVDAWRVARRSTDYELRPWQTSGLYLAVFVVCNLLVMPLLIDWVRTNQVRPFKAPSSSMLPTIQPGDFLFADMRYNCPLPICAKRVVRGDIAVFIYPNDRSFYYIKRIIGLPGDTVKIQGRKVILNGKSLSSSEGSGEPIRVQESIGDRTWQVQWSQSPNASDSAGEPAADKMAEVDITVGPGQVFFLGNNRLQSRDSRSFGVVPLVDVVGRARQVWFSWGEDGDRWNRIGGLLTPG